MISTGNNVVGFNFISEKVQILLLIVNLGKIRTKIEITSNIWKWDYAHCLSLILINDISIIITNLFKLSRIKIPSCQIWSWKLYIMINSRLNNKLPKIIKKIKKIRMIHKMKRMNKIKNNKDKPRMPDWKNKWAQINKLRKNFKWPLIKPKILMTPLSIPIVCSREKSNNSDKKITFSLTKLDRLRWMNINISTF